MVNGTWRRLVGAPSTWSSIRLSLFC